VNIVRLVGVYILSVAHDLGFQAWNSAKKFCSLQVDIPTVVPGTSLVLVLMTTYINKQVG